MPDQRRYASLLAKREDRRLAGTAAGPSPAPRHFLRPRLVAIAPSMAGVVRFAGGWLFDQAMAGWDATVLTDGHADPRPARILGARTCDLEDALGRPVWGPCLQAIAVQADLYDADPRLRRMVLTTLDAGLGELWLWGEGRPVDLDGSANPVRHQLSVAARAFKAQALAALPVLPPVTAGPVLPPPAAGAVPADPGQDTEMFRRAAIRRPSLIPAG